MVYQLNEFCFFVSGVKRAAIYNLSDGRIYSINESGKKIIIKFINKETNLNSMENEYIYKLHSMKLISFNFDEIQMVKVPDVNVKLNYVWLELTSSCNLRCVHCYGAFGRAPCNSEFSLKLNEWKDVLKSLVEHNCFSIQLIGGEPLFFKDFIEILCYAHEVGIKRIDVFTNATLIDEKIIKEFLKYNVCVRVSLYGHNADIHDKITSVQGSFKKTDFALKLLKKAFVPTTIAVVLMKENESYLEEIKTYVNNIGFKFNGYDVIRPTQDLNLKDHKISNIDLLKSRYNTHPEFKTSHAAFNLNRRWNNCWFGKMAITSSGDVIPCIFSRNDIVGNIKYDHMDSILKNIVTKWKIKKDDIEVCKDCEYRYACHDCRPLAAGLSNGNLFSKYPRCCYNPYDGTWEKVENVTFEL